MLTLTVLWADRSHELLTEKGCILFKRLPLARVRFGQCLIVGLEHFRHTVREASLHNRLHLHRN